MINNGHSKKNAGECIKYPEFINGYEEYRTELNASIDRINKRHELMTALFTDYLVMTKDN